jgi:hypothetical protein
MTTFGVLWVTFLATIWPGPGYTKRMPQKCVYLAYRSQFCGGGGGIRTCDQGLMSPLLCH